MTDEVRSSPEGYEIRREVGRGATAVVYLAHDRKHDRLVALKHLQSDLLLTPTRFVAEIRTIAGMQHPHILPLHDSGVWDESPFYVMPFVDGLTLEQRIAQDGALSLHAALRIAREVADALAYAHRHGVIHRDIKPGNILLADAHAYVADFGIAHVISLASSMRVTGTGFAVGTPAYMSPEQAAGEHDVDGRSDVYSLGCVMFEMLSGVPPFTGSTPQAVMARRVADPVPSVRRIRPRVPEAVERVVTRALSPDPVDRFQTAGDLVHALDAAVLEMDRRTTFHTRRRAVILAGALLVAGGGAMVYTRGAAGEGVPELNPSLYAVLPFRHSGTLPNMWLDGDGCARLLQDAMARWQGVQLVDGMRVNDVWSRQQTRTVGNAIAAARTLHAGQLAWGEVVGYGDSLEIRAVAYDITRGANATRQFVVRLARDAPQLERAFTALADSILVGGKKGREGASTGTRNLVALEAFLEGRTALDSFDLPLASRRFKEAAAVDESYVHAHFWSARTAAWSGEADPSDWASSAARAVALSGALPPREKAHAAALLDLAEGRMQAACRRYRALVVADSLDFAAWFGLGDCNARDESVVRNPRTPGSYSFNGSLHTAVLAYRRALAILPTFYRAERGLAFRRLSRRVLYTDEMRLRRGVGVPPDTQRFGAFPTFAANTLAFVPTPYLVATEASARPAGERAAVEWSVETYRQIMADWVRAFPADADARESNALALEAASGLPRTSSTLADALAEARRALVGSISADDRSRRTVMIVRLLLKSDSTAAARNLADSALRASPAPSPNGAGYLAGLAAMTGRASLAASLRARAASDSEHISFYDRGGRRAAYPTDLMASALQLESYAALGGPRDSVRATFGRTTRLLDARVPLGNRAEMRQTLFRNAYGLAYDQLLPIVRFPLVADRDLVLAMQQAMTKRDTVATRRWSRALAMLSADYAPGTVGFDRVHRYALMLLVLGDTSDATKQLDDALESIPRRRSIMLKAIPQAAALVPTMVLRAELAWRAKDYQTFERWARPAVILWSDADPELRATINILNRRLAGRT